MDKAKRYLRKNLIQSGLMGAIGIVSLIVWFLLEGSSDYKMFQAIGIVFTLVGVINLGIYYFGRNNKRIKNVMIAENDEMAKKIQRCAGDATCKITFLVVAAGLIFEKLLAFQLWEGLIIIIVIMAASWIVSLLYFTKKYC